MKRAENQPVVEATTIYGGVFTKAYTVPDVGTMIPQHAHHYDHATFLYAGSIRAWCDDVLLGDFHAPAILKIPAHSQHRFQSLCDGVGLACIHSVDAADGEDFNEDHLVESEHQIVEG